MPPDGRDAVTFLPVHIEDVERLVAMTQALHRAGRYAEALAGYRALATRRPDWLAAWLNAAICALELADGATARSLFEQSLTLSPEEPRALDGLARACALLGDGDGCIAAQQRLVARQSEDPARWFELAVNCRNRLRNDEAQAAFNRVLALDPYALNARWEAWQALPAPYADADAVNAAASAWRAGLAHFEALDLARPEVRHYLPELLHGTGNFLLHALPGSHVAEQRRYARLVRRCADLVLRAPPAPRKRAPRWRLRIGVVSAHLHRHTVGNLFRHWPAWLAANGFEVVVFATGRTVDDALRGLRGQVHGWVDAPRNAQQWLDAIAAAELDALIYTDIGLDPLAQILAGFRLAPLQAATWGHPVTSGSDEIDVFFGSDWLEPADAVADYGEHLVRLPELGLLLEAPATPVLAEPRQHDGLQLFCPQAYFKLLPEHDAAFARIAAALPEARITLVPSAEPVLNRRIAARLGAAFRAAGADPDRQLAVLEFLPPTEYEQLLVDSDLLLDTWHWSGGMTTLSALRRGVPVITREIGAMRGRQSAGLLRALGADTLIRSSLDDYVDAAIALARDRDQRAALRHLLRDRMPSLYGRDHGLRVLAGFQRERCGAG